MLLASLVIHNALTRYAATHPQSLAAAMPWPGQASIPIAMRAVDQAAGRGEEPSADVVRRLTASAIGWPMAVEPLLVAAIEAQRQGDQERADGLLLAALKRDPRAPAVRYFLADHYRRRGQVAASAEQLAMLVKLQPERDVSLMPYFVGMAREKDGLTVLQPVVRANPAYGRTLLAKLAQAGVEDRTILALAEAMPSDPSDSVWQSQLVDSVLRRGEAERAYHLWQGFKNSEYRATGLFNPKFRPSRASPPFAWSFASGADGVAEPNGKGGLDILYFGRNATVLASQTLILPAGTYRMRWSVGGLQAQSAALAWRVYCLSDQADLARSPLPSGQLTIAVAKGCPAQRIDLLGQPDELAGRVSARMSGLSLDRAP